MIYSSYSVFLSIPFTGVSAIVGSGLHSAASASDAIPRDGRQNKKSKWDKVMPYHHVVVHISNVYCITKYLFNSYQVDGDRRNPVISGGSDAASAHTALLSSANVGSGYMAFA